VCVAGGVVVVLDDGRDDVAAPSADDSVVNGAAVDVWSHANVENVQCMPCCCGCNSACAAAASCRHICNVTPQSLPSAHPQLANISSTATCAEAFFTHCLGSFQKSIPI
jgi:hypothetical protein